ncbi:MAG: LLM class flavin-dependent oxidoreductase [Acidimicrobiia bacterium]|nr:LLM class flavin-dependent oxidoreductase [Acidimicrobiia bacterium]
MKVGIKVNAPVQAISWTGIRDMAQAAEAGGLDSVWSEDHHFEPYGGPWDVWSVLAALAAVTDRVELGPIVASTNYYPSPVILARKAAAVHEISGGRLILGLGAGSGDFEYAKLGLPFDHPVGRFEEAFEIVRRLLAGERFDYDGRFHRLEDTWLSPVHRLGEASAEELGWLDDDWATQPVEPLDIPLMAGSLGPRMLGIVLPHVAGWNVHWGDRIFWNRPEAFPDVAERIAEHAEGAGVDPGSLWSSAEIFMEFDGARGLPVPVPDDLAALPADVETLQRCAEAGIDHLIVLVDPQTPAAVERLADVVQGFRGA